MSLSSAPATTLLDVDGFAVLAKSCGACGADFAPNFNELDVTDCYCGSCIRSGAHYASWKANEANRRMRRHPAQR